MGFALTILYVVLTIISPGQFGLEFASYHPMFYLAAFATVASLPGIFTRLDSRPAIQTQLAILFIIAIVVSQLHNGWMAASSSLQQTLPSAVVLFLVVVNVTTLRRVQTMIWFISAACLGLTIEALCGYYDGFGGDVFVLLQLEIRRLRSAGFLNDPNDFAQFILMVLPLLFIGWNRGRIVLNSLIVIPCVAFFLWAVYLTHSRGALVALGVLLLVTFHKKIGAVPSAALAGLFAFGLFALNFTGGRGISAADGVDRLELWAEGLQYFKRAPLFGIGFNEFGDSDFSSLTAHNSFVLCLAELGLLGSTVFMGLLVTTFMGLGGVINAQALADPIAEDNSEREVVNDDESHPCAEITESGTEAITSAVRACELETESELDHDVSVLAVKPYAVALRLTFISFITTSFFLSRSYSPIMFLMLGLAVAIIALEPKAIQFADLRRQVLVTCVAEGLAILLIYGVVRLRS